MCLLMVFGSLLVSTLAGLLRSKEVPFLFGLNETEGPEHGPVRDFSLLEEKKLKVKLQKLYVYQIFNTY